MGERSRVDKISGEFFRKGRCRVCGRSCERTKTLSATTMKGLHEAGNEWGKTPLVHKKCEGLPLTEERKVETTAPL